MYCIQTFWIFIYFFIFTRPLTGEAERRRYMCRLHVDAERCRERTLSFFINLRCYQKSLATFFIKHSTLDSNEQPRDVMNNSSSSSSLACPVICGRPCSWWLYSSMLPCLLCCPLSAPPLSYFSCTHLSTSGLAALLLFPAISTSSMRWLTQLWIHCMFHIVELTKHVTFRFVLKALYSSMRIW